MTLRKTFLGLLFISIACLQSGCATIEGQGCYINFVNHDCSGYFSNPYSGDPYGCSWYLSELLKYPKQFQKMTIEFLQTVSDKNDVTAGNVRYLLLASDNPLTEEEAKAAIDKLDLSPFDDNKFATDFWESARNQKWDLSWMPQAFGDSEIANHFNDFKELVLDKVTDDVKGQWAETYYKKWESKQSPCTNEALNIYRTHLKKQVQEDLKQQSYNNVTGEIYDFYSIQEFAKNSLDAELSDDFGIAYLNLSQTSNAIDLFDSAANLDPKNSIYKQHLTQATKEWIDNAEQLMDDEDYEQITNNPPSIQSNEKISTLLGTAYYNLGIFDQSDKSFQQAEQLDPHNKKIKNWITKVEAAQDQQEKTAEENLKKAPCFFPGSPSCSQLCQTYTERINSEQNEAIKIQLMQEYTEGLVQMHCLQQ